MKEKTNAIHAGRSKDQYGAVVTPIYRTSTFAFDNIEESGERAGRILNGENQDFLYTRMGNPTNADLERRLAALEKANDCVVTASGMGAISTAIWSFSDAGCHILADTALYGSTFNLLNHTVKRFGVEVDFVDFNDLEAVANGLKDNTQIVYFETPCNPTLKVNDIEAIARIAHDFNPNIKVMVDNTFASPVLQNPIELGANIVLHSLSKYCGGHSDLIGGAILTSNHEEIMRLRFDGIENITGAVMSPDNAFLVSRGLQTLPVRMNCHCDNALRLARWMEENESISRVYYPGLESHPNHETAKKQMRQFGGMIAFELAMTFEEACTFVNSLKLVNLAVSLGGVESLIEHPASMTHHNYSEEELNKAGITLTQMRMSVGIEDIDDIISDIQQAIDTVKANRLVQVCD